MDVLQLQNKLLVSIPEVESVVGKIGRADSPLDPAPISMIETFITYKSEYKTDLNGNRLEFRYDVETGKYARDQQGALIGTKQHHGHGHRLDKFLQLRCRHSAPGRLGPLPGPG